MRKGSSSSIGQCTTSHHQSDRPSRCRGLPSGQRKSMHSPPMRSNAGSPSPFTAWARSARTRGKFTIMRALGASSSVHIALDQALVEFSIQTERIPVEVNFGPRDAGLVHDGIGSPQRYNSRSVTTCGCAIMVCEKFRSHSDVGEEVRTRNGSDTAESYNVLLGWFRRFPTKIRPSDAAQLTKVAYCAIAHLAMVTDAQVPPFLGQSEAMAIQLHRPASW